MNRSKFTKEEDKRLLLLGKIFGSSDWISLKKHFSNRTTRQLKDRWQKYLNPKINHNPWTKEEDQILISAQLMYGNSWKTINQKFSQIELIFRSEIDLST
jgi:hypothetical protein